MTLDSTILIAVPVAALSAAAHECAHAVAARACSVPSARDAGRGALDPRPRLDVLGSILVPAALTLAHAPVVFAWGRPAPLEPAGLRRPHDDAVRVALAGPLASLALALGCAGLARLAAGAPSPLPGAIARAGVMWNCALALFHLIPIPPLDGAWVLMRFLRLRHILALRAFQVPALALVVLLALVPGASSRMFAGSLRLAVSGCLALFGVPPGPAR